MAGSLGSATASPGYLAPPSPTAGGVTLQWYWQIRNPVTESQITSGTTATANIWDTDEFEDANSLGANGDPNGPSTIVSELHAADKYSICYLEAGAYQLSFPDDGNFSSIDYTDPGHPTVMQGYPNEEWMDTAGFSGWSAANPTVFPDTSPSNDQTNDVMAAQSIASAMSERIAGCHAEGQDAIEPDDLDAYTNSNGWGLTQADAQGYEAWVAYTAHQNGLAVFQKNDGADTPTDEPLFDGMIIEECNHNNDPCGAGGDNVEDYINAGKPVLSAEYTQDGETTASFCPADIAADMTGALFDVGLGGGTYEPCQIGSGYTLPLGAGTNPSLVGRGSTNPAHSTSTTMNPASSGKAARTRGSAGGSNRRGSPPALHALKAAWSRASKRLTVTYTDTQAARSMFSVLRHQTGIRSGGRCVIRPRHRRPAKSLPCNRYVPVGGFAHPDHAGRNRLRLASVSGHKLVPGSYTLDATPRAHGLTGATAIAVFTVIG